jgi:hypothetical protein
MKACETGSASCAFTSGAGCDGSADPRGMNALIRAIGELRNESTYDDPHRAQAESVSGPCPMPSGGHPQA